MACIIWWRYLHRLWNYGLDITKYWYMMTSSNGNIFRVTGPLCGEFTGTGEFPTQRPVTRSYDVFFDPRLNKRLSKQTWGWWFETLSSSLWRQCNDILGASRTSHVLSYGHIDNVNVMSSLWKHKNFKLGAWICLYTSRLLFETHL